MNEALATINPLPAAIESVLIGGDLSKLNAEQRITYYRNLCESLQLNPLTRPFEYLVLSGKTVLYARKDATEQLRGLRGVSITSCHGTVVDGIYVVTASASDRSGRSDIATGAVDLGTLKGEAKANAMMKAETKAKRRVTLSLCGLGMLDETETDSIPGAQLLQGDDLPKARPALRAVVVESAPVSTHPDDDTSMDKPPINERAKALWQTILARTGGDEDAAHQVLREITAYPAGVSKTTQRPYQAFDGCASWGDLDTDKRLAIATDKLQKHSVFGNPSREPGSDG